MMVILRVHFEVASRGGNQLSVMLNLLSSSSRKQPALQLEGVRSEVVGDKPSKKIRGVEDIAVSTIRIASVYSDEYDNVQKQKQKTFTNKLLSSKAPLLIPLLPHPPIPSILILNLLNPSPHQPQNALQTPPPPPLHNLLQPRPLLRA